MQNGSKYQQKKEEIIQLIKGAAPPKPQGSAPSGRARSATIPFLLLIISLLGSTIPSTNLNIFFSISAIVSGLVWFHLWWKFGRRFAFSGWKAAVLVVALASQIAGCSGLMFNDKPVDLVAMGIQSQKIKVGEADGIGFAGFGLQDVTPKAAMRNGNIQKAIGMEETRSYGLISMARIRVYGE